jgi:hypothetical protein
MAFASRVTSQLLETGNYRADGGSDDPRLRQVLWASLLLQASSLVAPPVRAVLRNARPRFSDLALAVLAGKAAVRARGRNSIGWRREIRSS